MEKKITYKGKTYHIEVVWATQNYFIRVIGIGGFVLLPIDCLNDIEKIKPYILESLANNHDLKVIELWDGNI